METIRLIEQYLDGTLSQEERAILEEKANADQDFKNLINLHKEVNESIKDTELHALKSLLEKINATYERSRSLNPVKQLSVRKYFFRMAASIIFIAAVGIVLKVTLFSKLSNERLYQKYYVTYNADVISRSVQYDQQMLDKAILNYSQEQYSDALLQLNAIVTNDKKNYMAWFYRGLTCLETNATSEAIRSFKSIPDSWNCPFKEHRDWYLALAQLKHGDTAVAANAFKKISDDGGYYAKKAIKIYRKLTI